MTMRCARGVVLAGLVVLFAASQAQARGRWRRRPRPKSRPKAIDLPKSSNPERALEWMTDFDLAAKLAASEKRGIMILFTTEDLMKRSNFCRFAANSVRRAVRSAKAVPLRLLPPVRLTAVGLPNGEIAKREEMFKKAQKKYRELVRRYGVSRAPCLVLTSPEATMLNTLALPSDEQIRAALGRLGEMIAAHEKIAAEKAGAGKLAVKPKVEKPAAKPAEKPVEKIVEKKLEVEIEDDF